MLCVCAWKTLTTITLHHVHTVEGSFNSLGFPALFPGVWRCIRRSGRIPGCIWVRTAGSLRLKRWPEWIHPNVIAFAPLLSLGRQASPHPPGLPTTARIAPCRGSCRPGRACWPSVQRHSTYTIFPALTGTPSWLASLQSLNLHYMRIPEEKQGAQQNGKPGNYYQLPDLPLLVYSTLLHFSASSIRNQYFSSLISCA